MKRTAAAVIILLFSAGALCGPAPLRAESLAYTIKGTILVADREAAAEAVCSWAEGHGGYFIVRSTDRIVLRFSASAVGEFPKFLESLSEEIPELNQQAVDLLSRILELKSGIAAREEILAKNLSYLDGADVKGTLAIEKEVNSLIREIETLKGTLRKAETDARLAYADIHLSFVSRDLPEKIPSSFPWINTLNFYSFIQGGP